MNTKEIVAEYKKSIKEKEQKIISELQEIDLEISEFKQEKKRKRIELNSLKREEKNIKENLPSPTITQSIIEKLQNEESFKKIGGVSIDSIRDSYNNLGIRTSLFTIRNQICNLILDNKIGSNKQNGRNRLYKTIEEKKENETVS